MKINYLLSGVDKELGFTSEHAKYLKQDIKDNSTITFIASAFSDIEKTDKYLSIMINWFKKIDITFKEVHLVNDLVTPQQAQQYINKSDIVFIMGGDTLLQMKNINNYNIISNLKNREGITIGISAGSINMADNVVLARDLDDNVPDHSFYKGIGLVNINIEPHFDLNNLKHNPDIIEISKDNKIVCLPDESFIRIQNDNIEIIGDYYIFYKNGITYNDIKLSLLEDKEENYKLLEKWCSNEKIYKHFEQRILSYSEIKNKYNGRCNEDSDVPVYMINYKDQKIGIIQYKKINDTFDIDIFIGETNFHNKGIGKQVINLFTNYLINIKGAQKFSLVPLKDNLNAIRCYEKCGYKVVKEIKDKNTIGEEKEYVQMMYEK